MPLVLAWAVMLAGTAGGRLGSWRGGADVCAGQEQPTNAPDPKAFACPEVCTGTPIGKQWDKCWVHRAQLMGLGCGAYGGWLCKMRAVAMLGMCSLRARANSSARTTPVWGAHAQGAGGGWGAELGSVCSALVAQGRSYLGNAARGDSTADHVDGALESVVRQYLYHSPAELLRAHRQHAAQQQG